MTKDDIIRMAEEARLVIDGNNSGQDDLLYFAVLVAAAEREACAKVCSEAAIKLFSGKSRVSQIDMHTAGVLQDTAEAIRARGTT